MRVTHISTRETQGRSAGEWVIFLELPRPLDEGKIMEDFAWRREVNYSDIAHDPKVKDFVVRYINERFKARLNPANYKLGFSRYAGCTCPCSPGLVLKHIDYGSRKMRAMYLDLGTNYQPPVRKRKKQTSLI